MFIKLYQIERGREFELIVNTEKIDSLIEYQMRIVVNGIYHSITPQSYVIAKNFIENKKQGE